MLELFLEFKKVIPDSTLLSEINEAAFSVTKVTNMINDNNNTSKYQAQKSDV